MPRIRSERPAFDLHYPHMAERMELEAHATLLPERNSGKTNPPT